MARPSALAMSATVHAAKTVTETATKWRPKRRSTLWLRELAELVKWKRERSQSVERMDTLTALLALQYTVLVWISMTQCLAVVLTMYVHDLY